MHGFLPHLTCELETNSTLAALHPEQHIAVLTDGRRYRYDQLISTMPLPQLIKLIGDEAPQEIHDAAAKLRHVSIRCVNIGVGRADLTEKHWIYYPGETLFHRIFVQGNASPFCNPPGGCGLTCEISYSPHKPLPVDGDALIQRCIQECIAVGMINADDPIITANRSIFLTPTWSTTMRAGEYRAHPRLAAATGYPAVGTLQRMGILQFRPRIPGGQARG